VIVGEKEKVGMGFVFRTKSKEKRKEGRDGQVL